MKNKLFALLFTALLPFSVFAEGIGFDVSLSKPSVSIGEAYYSGVGIGGRLVIPFIETNGFRASFDFTGKYLDLSNSVNSSSQRETANHIGLGAGLNFQLNKFVIGADYNMMKARHMFIGNIKSDYVEFDYSPMTLFGGIRVELGKSLHIGIIYEMTSGSVPGSELDLSSDPKYSDKILSIHLTYQTGESLGNFTKTLIK